MQIIAIILIIILYLYSLTFRLFVKHPINFIIYIIKDTYDTWKKYKWIPKKPFINCYVGLFGMGKTLTMVHDVINFYYEYDNRVVFDDRFGWFCKQKVLILSNVDFKTIPYKKLVSMDQINRIARDRHILDMINHRRTITIVVLDEASTQLSHRSYKSNFSIASLNTLLTSRHALIHGFYLTSQRFGHMDALLRQVTQNVIECKKVWRIVKNTYYDAWEYENSVRPTDCRIQHVSGFFATKDDYAAYDTLAVVDNLIKAQESGDMLSDREIREASASGRSITIMQQKKKKKRL